ncbi:MAG TPA: dihydrofolate reductase family protein [Gammaproteobacteria bacterium]|jgi:dihydrofolate reductase
MRKLIYAINLTIDGCFDHTNVVADDELHDYYTQLIRDAGPLVYGRKTYQLMVPFWPDIARHPAGYSKAEVEFAEAFDSAEKVVFSKSLDKVEGKNTRLVRSGLKDEILKLKLEPGKDILTGGVDIPSQLMALGLVDEYRLAVQPMIVGEGRRLLESIGLQKALPLKLVESRVFKSGCVLLRYLKQ